MDSEPNGYLRDVAKARIQVIVLRKAKEAVQQEKAEFSKRKALEFRDTFKSALETSRNSHLNSPGPPTPTDVLIQSLQSSVSSLSTAVQSLLASSN